MYQNYVSMNIAIIGAGNKNESLAEGLLNAGHKIYFGTNEDSLCISNNSLFLSKSVFVCSIEDAGSVADIIIMSCPVEEVKAAAYYLNDVKKKIILDCVSSQSEVSKDHVQTVNAIRSITGAHHVVKWMQTSSYGDVKMYMAGDSKKAKIITTMLARDLGYDECMDMGGSDKADQLEQLLVTRASDVVLKGKRLKLLA